VAYESILLQRRKALHRTIGLAIEELYADRLVEHYETLAHHFTRAEEWQRAFDYHVRAAAKSMAAYATHAAVEHCRRAPTCRGCANKPAWQRLRTNGKPRRWRGCSWPSLGAGSR
jgi:predicted ATPase